MKRFFSSLLTVILCLCAFMPVVAESNSDFRVLHTISDFNSFADTEQLWDPQSPFGYIYAFESATTTGELVTDASGNKSVKCVFRGGGQYSHWHPWTIENWAAVALYRPDGFRMHVKTESKAVRLVPRMDFNGGMNDRERLLLTNRNLFAVNADGTRSTGDFNGTIVLPANFDGYVYFPLSIPGSLMGSSTPNLSLDDLEALDTVVIYAYPVSTPTFGDGITVYFDDFELYATSSYSHTPSVDPVFSPTPIVPVTQAPGNTAPPETPVITPVPTPVVTAEPTAEPTATATVKPSNEDVSPQDSLVYILAGLALIIAASVLGILFSRRKQDNY